VDIAGARVVVHEEPTTADSGAVRLRDTEGSRSGDRGVDGVAAAFQHIQADLGRVRIHREVGGTQKTTVSFATVRNLAVHHPGARVRGEELDFDDDQVFLYHGIPFTGVAYYDDDGVTAEEEYVDGLREGNTREWYPSRVLKCNEWSKLSRHCGAGQNARGRSFVRHLAEVAAGRSPADRCASPADRKALANKTS
jgi:hypothetical protein